ncbi:ABC transporter permease [Flagellimonas meridianipacifica]|uniref:Putative permease n=1 Tax=Flagellimonas meridianipacifica TaxID=1080225 RepID=A0A2T0MGY3_9FLAO|nr:ABC transporter permease [Allomuricauda pacifica]PRX56840.1 putative permease [Allomuricauda pacifica]
MLKNYLKIAWRNIVNNKVFSLLNTIGLATGLSCSLLIYLWVSDELAMDKYHENIDRLYSVYQKQIFEGRVDALYATPAPLYRELKNKIPEIEQATPASWKSTKTFAYENKTFKQEGYFVGEDYFNIFSYNILAGTIATAMDSPDDLVISEQMAQKFFGSATNAIGKSIIYENSRPLTVSAVFKEVNSSNSKKSDFFLHWDIFLEENGWAPDITNSGSLTFLLLKENSDVVTVKDKLKDFLTPYRTQEDANFTVELELQPFGETYLNSHFENGIISGGRIENVRIFGFIAFFVLLIACINFMNLASASSLKRAKEVGVRKSLGAKKGSLVSQFLGEALLLTLLSTFLALILVTLLLPLFNELSGKNLSLLELSPISWLGILGITLLTGVVSGSYPSFVLSSFSTIDIFKNNSKANASSQWIRKGLVVFQFALTIVLISGMLITSRQIHFIQHQDLGFDRHNVVLFIFQGDSTHSYASLKERALKLPGVESVSITDAGPMQISNGFDDVVWAGKPADDPTIFMSMAVGSNFSKAWGTEILLGSDFSDITAADDSGYIINETALKIMGLKDPIGQPLAMWGREGQIVGVMKDFPLNTLKSTIPPLIIRNGEQLNRGAVLARIRPENAMQTVEALQELYTEMLPEIPFEYVFSDAWYNDMYKSENVFFKLSQYFSLIAIFISCLGLFGLVIFSAQQRVKEIGIRKVLGASVQKITSLLINDFLKLVVLGITIGFPIAWYIMDKWLTSYEYRIEMPWWTFGLSGTLVVALALLTVGFKSVSAAMENPVKSLRTE